jgi:Domain of unknown function (DUF1772)
LEHLILLFQLSKSLQGGFFCCLFYSSNGFSPLLAQQWQFMYDKGKIIMPPLSIIPTVLYAYLAWRERSSTGSALPLYATAAVLSPSFVTYTLLAMGDVNGALMQKAKESSTASFGDMLAGAVAEANGTDNTHSLADQWGLHNLVRASMTGVAGFLALCASLGP